MICDENNDYAAKTIHLPYHWQVNSLFDTYLRHNHIILYTFLVIIISTPQVLYLYMNIHICSSFFEETMRNSELAKFAASLQ